MPTDRSAATCSRCGHPVEEHKPHGVLPFAPCRHADTKEGKSGGLAYAFAYLHVPCWCPNLEGRGVTAARDRDTCPCGVASVCNCHLRPLETGGVVPNGKAGVILKHAADTR